jgi:hypothetical protein
MSRKPVPNLYVLVIGSVVLDQKDFLGKVASKEPLQVTDIGQSIEGFLKVVKKTGGIEFDRAKDL